jgi:hypothetical protein
MIVLKDFTEKGNPKRWKKGDAYTGTRGKELAAKGLVSEGKSEVKEKVEVKPVAEKVEVTTLSTQKVKKGK